MLNARFMQVVGFDAHVTKDHEESWLLCKAHLEGLRAVPCLREARVVFIAECNLAAIGQIMSQRMVECHNVQIACAKKGSYGVKTVTLSKERYVLRLMTRLDHDAICYHSHLVSVNPFKRQQGWSYDKILADTKGTLEQQLYQFSGHIKTPRTLSTHGTSIVYSGKIDKHGKQSASMRDDLALAALMACFWSGQVLEGMLTLIDYHHRLHMPMTHNM